MQINYAPVDVQPKFYTIPDKWQSTIKLFEFFINRNENRLFQIVDFVDGSVFESDKKIDYIWILEIGDRSKSNKRKFVKIPISGFVHLLNEQIFEYYNFYHEQKS